jgi:hypothetical protein
LKENFRELLVFALINMDIDHLTDGRIRKWRYIEEMGKYLRIILLDDGETIHNAFFDRNFKEEEK